MDKPQLRSVMGAQRQALSADDVRLRSAVIAERVKGELNWQLVRTVHVYRSSAQRREVDTSWFEAFVFELWPHIDVTIGSGRRDEPVPDVPYDVIIIPLLAFDDRRHRLGYGGGWYDRFLATQPLAVTIGLAYDIQRVSQILAEPHDIALTKIVTDTSVYG